MTLPGWLPESSTHEPSPFMQRFGQEKLLILLRSDLGLGEGLGLSGLRTLLTGLPGMSPVLHASFLFASY